MVLVAFHSPMHEAEPWRAALAERLPEARFMSLEEAANIDEESYAVVLYHPHGALARLPKLKAVLSIAAGVDHLLADPALPDVPIYRQTDVSLQQTMVEFAMMAVLMHHRDMPQYIAQQREECSDIEIPLTLAPDRTVAVLGLGNLGNAVAIALQRFGFRTVGWSRTAKNIPNVQCYHGESGLNEMLGISEILVNVLPLTPQTTGMMNADFMAKMSKGASIVNIGRGGHVNEADLIKALDDGHLNAAILDVVSTEPLPSGNPLWTHPKVVLTPHVAGDILMETAIPNTFAKMQMLMNGETPNGRYQHDLGY